MSEYQVSRKPQTYGMFAQEKLTALLANFVELERAVSMAWHQAGQTVYQLNQKCGKSRSISNSKMLEAYSNVWQYYDRELRAVLYSDLVGVELNRSSIVNYLAGHSDTDRFKIDEQINHEVVHEFTWDDAIAFLSGLEFDHVRFRELVDVVKRRGESLDGPW